MFVGIASCSDPPEVSSTAEALSAAQCVYFSINGKTTICHATGSASNPTVVIKIAEQGCINGHSKHPHDSIAVDGVCAANSCLATGAPCDPTRPCCDGLSCTAGVCLAPTCVFPQQVCNGTCTSVSSDPNNCGACGSDCAGAEACCDGACFDEQNDLDHCGGCDIECAAAINPECAAAVCTAGACGFDYRPAGTPVSSQTSGDCRIRECDGGDAIADTIADGDVPVDGNPCTDDVCTAGVPSNPPSAAGTTCGPGLVCDGQGACVACLTAADCPAPTNAECGAATCTAGTCGFAHQAAGTPLAAQAAGDCHLQQCDGSGNAVNAVDDSDRPVDGNECTDDVCVDGVPSNPSLAAETSCGGAQVCDGQGACVGCVTPSNCPAPTKAECATASCTANTCGFDYRAAGTPVSSQTAGDCHVQQCDGSGNITNAIDNFDPASDDNECTDDVCVDGVPANPPAAAETSCGFAMYCDGVGACVDCVTPAHCAQPAEPQCATAACTAGTCGIDYQPGGTAVAVQTAGDCHTRQCDGHGSIADAIDDTDSPVDSNPCTDDVCAGGMPLNPPVDAGASCGNDMMCDGLGTCVVCLSAADCPPPSDNECAASTCTFGFCGFDYTLSGTPVTSQTAGDCQVRVCDGAGSVASAIDDNDRPFDTNPCTDDACAGGVPSNLPTAAETSCGAGMVCSGLGACVGCVSASNCPEPTNSQCAAATCTEYACGISNRPNGTVCTQPALGACVDGLCCQAPVTPTTTFTNTTTITAPATGTASGPASPYPSAINVSGLEGTVVKVTATLNGLTHTFPDDLDIVLIGPSGRSVILQSDAGGSVDVLNATVTFDDLSLLALPDSSLILNQGIYRPTNFGVGDTFPAPAPPGPYGIALALFAGTNPNGQWRLYVTDDTSGDNGRIQNGWTLRITTALPPVCQ